MKPASKVRDALPLLSKQDNRKKLGRNDPCPCGSGRKHKKCCLN
ncbi:SEC-C metal-binding domain-containing protein [Pusillimonas sp.]